MSSIEVSLLAPNYKMESDAGRTIRRNQRPSPSPPSLDPPPSSTPLPTTREKPLYPTLEISSSPIEAPDESIRNTERPYPLLLSEFQHLFEKFDYEFVRDEILDRRMTECYFATVLWRIFLHCLPRDSTQWMDMLQTSRSNYEKLVHTYKIDPYTMNDDTSEGRHVNHPLSQDQNSSWAQYFADEELKATITIDVRRTCPDISFFRNPRMIDLQLRILFAHSRHHQNTTPYRQGMHEILGIIVYAIHTESVQVNEYAESNELMKRLYDPQYLEHDAYAIFEKIMEHLRQFYSHASSHSPTHKSSAPKDNKKIPFQRLNTVHFQTNQTVARMKSIFERLSFYDRLLHCKLEELNIEPTVYGIRWLRLLFGREIPFRSIPSLWTVIFCFDEYFGFVDYFFIALLIEVGQIIGRQGGIGHHDCLQVLMQQNVISNVEPVIRKALNLTGRQLKPVPEPVAVPSAPRLDGSRSNTNHTDPGHATRKKELQRVRIAPASQPRLDRPNLTEPSKSASVSNTNLASTPMELTKSSSFTATAMASTSHPSKSVVPSSSIESEMRLWSDKTTRELYDENVGLQKCCARYMNKFIEQLQTIVYNMEAPNEDELHVQLSGLKQIANVLDGKLTFDTDSLQALLNYECREKTFKRDTSDTS